MPSMDQFSSNVQNQALMVQPQEPQVPFFMKALENLPSQTSMTALAGYRFSNTMFKGGYLDVASGATGRVNALRKTIGKRTGAFVGGAMGNADDYAFGKNFLGKFSSKKVKSALMTNANPIGFGRYDTVARLSGMAGAGAPYSPMQGGAFLANWALKPDFIRNRAAARYGSDVINNTADNAIWTGGVFGRIKTIDKADDYARAVSKANDLRSSLGAAAPSRSQGRVLKAGDKAAARLSKLDDSIVKLGKVTNANFARTGAINYIGSSTGISTSALAPDALNAMVSGTLKTGAADAAIASQVSNIGRARALYETIPGELSKSVFGHYNIMSGGKFADFADTAVGKRTVSSFAGAMEKYKFGSAGTGTSMGMVDDATHALKAGGFMPGAGYADDATRILSGGTSTIRSTSGRLAKEAFKAGDKATAAKMGGQYLSTYGKAAGKAFSAYGYATLAYDVGKGIGNMMMGGVNFAKDAMKSMQGTINKPVFGAGFKDNEVAASSRARGVMAIQNSRLNARSMLGSEGGMMAAHFG